MKAVIIEKVGGNYRVDPDGTSPSTPPDTEMSSTSTNAVQNKVIKAYVDEHSGGTPDIEMSSTSTNAAQNKVIKSYVDTECEKVKNYTDSKKQEIMSYVDNQDDVVKSYVDGQISALRTELMAVINSITGMTVSDTAPSDTSKVWIDTGGN